MLHTRVHQPGGQDASTCPRETVTTPMPVPSRRQHALRLSAAHRTTDKPADSCLPDELGKSVTKYNKPLSPHDFYSLVDVARGRFELRALSPTEHPAAPYLNHLRIHGADVVLRDNPSPERILRQILKGSHPSARLCSDFF